MKAYYFSKLIADLPLQVTYQTIMLIFNFQLLNKIFLLGNLPNNVLTNNIFHDGPTVLLGSNRNGFTSRFCNHNHGASFRTCLWSGFRRAGILPEKKKILILKKSGNQIFQFSFAAWNVSHSGVGNSHVPL